MKPRAISVRLSPLDATFFVLPGESVLEAALRQKVDIPTSCGGNGTCSACRVFVVSSELPLAERNEIEQEMADDRRFADDERLSCQLCPVGDLTLRLPEE